MPVADDHAYWSWPARKARREAFVARTTARAASPPPRPPMAVPGHVHRASAKDAALANALHVVASVKFGVDRLVTCRCGWTCNGTSPHGYEAKSNDGMLNAEFRVHVNHYRRRVAPVEVIEP